jgi:hypothetical protein
MKQLKAKLDWDRKQGTMICRIGPRKIYFRDNHTKMFTIDWLSGNFEYHGPKEKLP